VSEIWKSAEGARAVRERTQAFLAHWPVPSRQLRVPTREGETFVVACGAESAPPLVLLHGSGSNSVMWMGDVAAWATQFRVYSVDMIGEPGLSAPSRPALDSDAHALWLDDVLRELSLARASFVGLSLGGWLALDYAIRRPERVERLALLCPGGVGRQRPSFIWRVAPLLLLGAWGRRRAMALALGATEEPTTPVARAFGEYFALIHTHFRPRRDRLPVFSDAALRGLAMPVLAIVGGRDALLDSAETKRRLERSAPKASVELLPDQGHLLRGQTARVLDFLVRAQSFSA
jgi:pimeloyl-ACP methyl ester carboxylesterase